MLKDKLINMVSLRGADAFIRVCFKTREIETEFKTYTLCEEDFTQVIKAARDEVCSRKNRHERFAMWEVHDGDFRLDERKKQYLIALRSKNDELARQRQTKRKVEKDIFLSWCDRLADVKRQMVQVDLNPDDFEKLIELTRNKTLDELEPKLAAFKYSARELGFYEWEVLKPKEKKNERKQSNYSRSPWARPGAKIHRSRDSGVQLQFGDQ